jgi:uncharacterized protein (TIGR00369 family)
VTGEIAADVPPAIASIVRGIAERFRAEHPFFGGLDFQPVRVARGEVAVLVTAQAAYEDEGFVHGGFFTIVLDSMCGMATFLMLDEMQPIATIDLKVDTQARVPAGTRVLCEARCEGVSDDVAVVRGQVRTEDGRLVAVGAATFMVGTRSAQVSRI